MCFLEVLLAPDPKSFEAQRSSSGAFHRISQTRIQHKCYTSQAISYHPASLKLNSNLGFWSKHNFEKDSLDFPTSKGKDSPLQLFQYLIIYIAEKMSLILNLNDFQFQSFLVIQYLELFLCKYTHMLLTSLSFLQMRQVKLCHSHHKAFSMFLNSFDAIFPYFFYIQNVNILFFQMTSTKTIYSINFKNKTNRCSRKLQCFLVLFYILQYIHPREQLFLLIRSSHQC